MREKEETVVPEWSEEGRTRSRGGRRGGERYREKKDKGGKR